MKQIQFFKYATLLMLVLNLGLVAFFFLTKPKPPMRGETFSPRAIEILQLDKDQHQAFLQSAEQHGKQMRTINDGQRNLLRPYFNGLVDPSLNLNPDSILQQVQLLERQKVEATYLHFKAVKALLRDEQQNNFEQFMNQALGRLLLNDMPSKPPRPK